MAKKSSKSTGSEALDRLGDLDQPTTPSLGLLESAVRATHTGSACFAHMADIAPLLTHPNGQLVEYNDAMTDGNGRIALRATAAGVQVFQANGNGAASMMQAVMRPFPATGGNPNDYEQPSPQRPFVPTITEDFLPGTRPVLKSGIPIPPVRTRSKPVNQHEFETMEVGQCFDIMPTGADPEPWKKLTSAASNASKKLAPKKFLVRRVEENGVTFARTWRTA